MQFVLKPTYKQEQIDVLDKVARLSRDYYGATYYPGVMGMNIIKANDYCNVVLQVRNFDWTPQQ